MLDDVIAALCPPAPALVPVIGVGAEAELGEVRAHCDAAVKRLVAASSGRIGVVAGTGSKVRDERSGGTLRGYGVDVRAGGERFELGPEHTLGAWLLDRAGHAGPRAYLGAAADLSACDAVLMLADGTIRRTPRAPGAFDPRAAAFDAEIADLLASGGAPGLTRLDGQRAEALGCAGLPVLAALGAAAAQASVRAELLYDDAPLGVGYWVAVWSW